MKRKKILFCSEGHHLPTGYSVYTKEVLSRLCTDPRFEVAELACYTDSATAAKHQKKWKIFPNQPEKDTADFSAISTWGVFRSEFNKDNIILLDCIKDRWEFPELKKVALEQYKYWEPETIIVEAKASGQPLIQELRQVGIPVVSFSPSKGNDKISRVNAVAPLFESGVVWAPEKHFAEEMIEECAAFPYGEYDDLVDTMTQALMRYRQGNFISLNDDYEDQPREKKQYVYY